LLDSLLQETGKMFCSWKTGEIYKDHFEAGVYVCAKCSHPLFSSETKFAHGSPWPAFSNTITPDSLKKVEERRGALKVSCGQCGSGLGHEFLGEGPKGASRF